MDPKIKNRIFYIGWITWFIAAIFYGYEFTLKVSPHTMTAELIRDFGINNTQLGKLSAFYFYTYGLTLIPAGYILDRYNYNTSLLLASFAVSLGSFLLASTSDIYIAYLSRAIIGGGSAFAFLGCLKIASDWLPSKKFPFMVGLTDLFGKIGALTAGKPLAWLVATQEWRGAMYILANTGLAISVLLLINTILMPVARRACDSHRRLGKTACNEIAKRNNNENKIFVDGLKSIIKSKQTWLLAIYGGLLVAPIIGYVELWGTPFLETAYGISKQSAASINSLVYIGIAFGGPSIGYLSSRYQNYKVIMFLCTIISFVCFSLVIYISMPLYLIRILLFIYGACTSNMLLCFTLTKIIHSKKISTLAIGFTNTIINIFGAISQPLIGKILDYYIKTSTHTIHYPKENFQSAFAILPVCLILALPLISQFKTSIIKGVKE